MLPCYRKDKIKTRDNLNCRGRARDVGRHWENSQKEGGGRLN